MRVEELIGERLRQARELRDWTQQELGAALEPYLGRPWTRQAVSNAEKGGRDFGAAELLAFATVLRQHVPWFFMASTADPITLPGSETLTPAQVMDKFASMGELEASDHLDSVARLNEEIHRQARTIEGCAGAVREYLFHIQQSTGQAVGEAGQP